MDNKIVLSIDSNLYDKPELLNIGIEKWEFSWLKIIKNAEMFRSYINNNTTKEIWIISNDDIEAINLAATIKKDKPNSLVCLISFDLTGSLQSRANAAKIDRVMTLKELKERISGIEESNLSKSNNKSNFVLSDVPNLLNKNQSTNKAFVLSVMSASGGSGKTCISSIAAILCQLAGFKTLLIDADFQFGDIPEMFRAKNLLTIDKLIENRASISQLRPVLNGPCILAPPKFSELADKSLENFPNVLESLKELFDVIIVNTGSYWNELQAVLLERDSKSIFVIDQRPTSVNATKKAMDLCNRCGIATGSVMFAINKCSKRALFTSIDISCALQGAQVAEIMDGGIEVDEFFSSGKPIELVHSKNSFAVSVWAILENILPKDLLISRKVDIKKQEVNKKDSKKTRKHSRLFSLKRT